jgi:hypothetical protein
MTRDETIQRAREAVALARTEQESLIDRFDVRFDLDHIEEFRGGVNIPVTTQSSDALYKSYELHRALTSIEEAITKHFGNVVTLMLYPTTQTTHE